MTIILMFAIGIIIFVIWGFNKEKNEQQNNGARKIPNENTVKLAVLSIETAAEFVKKNQYMLDCNQITMWQNDTVGEGFIIEFYSYDIYSAPRIEKLLLDAFGDWKVWEDSDKEILHIIFTGWWSYTGSWNSFNRTVWDEVKRKHPEWKIEKMYSHKYVLYV